MSLYDFYDDKKICDECGKKFYSEDLEDGLCPCCRNYDPDFMRDLRMEKEYE